MVGWGGVGGGGGGGGGGGAHPKKLEMPFHEITEESFHVCSPPPFPTQIQPTPLTLLLLTPRPRYRSSMMQSSYNYNDLSSPAKLAAFINSEMARIGNALASVRQSIASLHRGEITALTSTQKATDIAERMYQTTRAIGQHRIALIRKRQDYRTQVRKIRRIIRAMREISKIGENAHIDAIVVMQLQLISDARRIFMQQKGEHASAIRVALNVQDTNSTKFAKLVHRIDAWLKEEDDARRCSAPCSCPDDREDRCEDGCQCQVCYYVDLYGY